MNQKPDNNRKKKHRNDVKLFRKASSVLFTAFILLIAYFVYRAVNGGAGLPTSSVGIVRMDQSMSTIAPTETEAEPEETDESVSEEPSETEEPTTQEPLKLSNEELAQQYLEEMTLEQKVWQLFCLSPSQMYYEDGTLCPAGGVYFGEEDLTDEATLASDVQTFKDTASVPVMIGTSEEGGENSSLTTLGVTDSFDSAATYAEIGNTGAVYDFANALGGQLGSAGFHFNLAPVADTINWYPDELNGRTYGTDIELASQMVENAVLGFQSSGVIPCLKHFPNLGSSAPDGDNDVSWRPYSSFVESDFIPFKAGIDAGAQMVLVSNMMVPDMCDNALMPSCMSENIVTNILRGELGFDGVIFSDVQSSRTDPQSTLNLLEAGCDVILLPNDAQASVAAVIEAVNTGAMTEERIDESVYRILLLKCENGIILQ